MMGDDPLLLASCSINRIPTNIETPPMHTHQPTMFPMR